MCCNRVSTAPDPFRSLPLGWLVAALACIPALAATGPLFLVDATRTPTVTISWPTSDGQVHRYTAQRPYRSPNAREFLGANLDCFVAVGGTRLDKGAGHPDGTILRVGFYKVDPDRLLFEDIAPDASITIELSGIAFNRPGRPIPHRAIQHLQYLQAQAAACGLGDAALDQFNTADARDSLRGKVTDANGRPGALDGSAPDRGRIRVRRDPDGTWAFVATIPYALFRHVRDPWLRTEPGAFLEPNHFHVEIEALPEEVASSFAEPVPPSPQD